MALTIEMESVEIVDKTSGSRSNLIVPLILIALIASTVSSASGGDVVDTPSVFLTGLGDDQSCWSD